jgi:cytochrome c oxidase subunit 1
MFTVGLPVEAQVLFMYTTMLIAIPTGIKIFNWVATMWRGSMTFEAPMLWALAFIFLFTIGGLTGLFLGTLSTDLHLHDTYFVVAHFHYVMMGGTLVAFLGGLFHWWPKMTGRMFNEAAGRLSALVVFIGFNLTFFPQFILGSRGMPRRYATYDPEFQYLHQVSSIGAFTLGIGLLIAGLVLLHALFRGKLAPANPWGGATLEWHCSSPPPFYNFKHAPVVGDPYEFINVDYDENLDGYVFTELPREVAPEPTPEESPASAGGQT